MNDFGYNDFENKNVKINMIDVARHLPFALGKAFELVWNVGHPGSTKKENLQNLTEALKYLDDYQAHPYCEKNGQSQVAWAIFGLFSPSEYNQTKMNALSNIVWYDSNAKFYVKNLIKEVENER